MSETDPSSDIAADNAVSFVVAVPYQDSDGPVAGSYAQVLRMGAVDSSVEGQIVGADGAPVSNPMSDGSDPGLFLYLADQLATFSPVMTVATEDQLTVTRRPDGSVLQFSAANAIGGAADYLVGRGLSMAFGLSTTLGMGGSVSATQGNTVSMNSGGQLSSNLGLTLNFSEGQIVTIAADDTAIQCRAGSVTSVGAGVTMATQSLNYALVDSTTLGTERSQKISRSLTTLGILLVVLINVANGMFGILMLTTVTSGQQRKSITTAIARLYTIAQLVHVLTLLVQGMGALYGFLYHRRTVKAIADTKVGLKLNKNLAGDYQAALTVGGMDPTASIIMAKETTTLKATEIVLDAKTKFSVTVGDSSITLDAGGITLKVGATELALDRLKVTAIGDSRVTATVAQ